jgi:formylglycine-generating enzyme required for sulfatase activity
MNTSRLSRLFYRYALVLVLGMIAVLPGQSAPDWEALQTAVVKIKTGRGNVSGTGCLIKIEGNRGYILTAYHVIQSAVTAGQQRVMVEFYRRLGALEGIIVNEWIQTDNDLAVLVVENVPVQHVLFFGTTEGLRKRDEVTAIGHPEGSPWAIKDGKVSNLVGRDVHFSGDAVDPGNSGGPLLNTQGQIVGMNIRVLGKTGVAIQSDVIKPIVRNWIGELPVTHAPNVPPKESEKPPRTPSTSEPAPKATSKEPEKVVRGKDGKDMLLVPEGWFEMGSNDGEDDEKPVHRVLLDTFYMDKYEVTVGEYTAFFRSTGRQGLLDYVATYAPGGQYPVVGVSWDDAEAYCRWAGKQLPTEAQWEKAARGTDRRQYPWGNEAVDGKRANYAGKADGYEYTAPVGTFPSGKSPYGIEDLAGNVWEWVQDWYTADYYRRSPERNPVNDTPAQYCVLRGGGWPNSPAFVRAADRVRLAPDGRLYDLGFRCVVPGAALRP